MPTQTQTGKAFEYALISEAKNIFDNAGIANKLVADNSLNVAYSCLQMFSSTDQNNYKRAANAAIQHLMELETKLVAEKTNDILELYLQADQKGREGDVRDIIFNRSVQNWQFGISAKNNHTAVKHCRLSNTINFGQEWLQIPCSENYFHSIYPVFQQLRILSEEGLEWKHLPNKHTDYYIPVLHAFADEMLQLNRLYADVPRRLVLYLIGNNDFYKVIRKQRVVEIRFNINGTLNRPRTGVRAYTNVQRLKLPTRIIQLEMRPGSTNTLMLICDEGWQISFRIHNAETNVVPSLKFDVKLVGQPQSLYSHHIRY